MRTTPRRLPRTALKMARASSPPEERESATHMLTVVGSTLITSMPSRSAGASHPTADSPLQIRRVISGISARLQVWISACKRTLAAARASSEVGRFNPASRKMPQVAPHATVISGLRMPPLRPIEGLMPARATDVTTPTRK